MTAILCDCGDCRQCRRAMGFDRPAPVEPVKLSESTLRLLADLDKPKTERSESKDRPKAVVRHRPTAPRRDYCKKDLHKMEGDNVRVATRPNGRVTRECRECIRDRMRAQRGATPRVTEKPTPVPWVECGELIGARRNGYAGWVLAGSDGKCELCVDRPKYEAFLEKYAAMTSEERTDKVRSAALKARKHLSRILKDGRAYHPESPGHGGGQSYLKYGCRCEPCVAWKTEDNRKRREAS